MAYKGISVVIPNYNGIQLLPQVLPCLFTALQNSGEIYEVIIPDDHSTDDSVAYLKENYPDIIVIESEKNQGFSPTINKGIFAARYDYLLLLNSDVKLTPNYFENLFRYFEKQDTFGVMGRIVGWDDDEIQDAAKFPRLQGLKIKTSGNYYLENAHKEDWVYSTYLSGANAFLDRKKAIQINAFDELFAPFYVEDFELSLRAWRLGFKCYYDHFSICRHRVSISIKSKNTRYFINTIYYRNKMFLQYIHLQGAQVYLWFLQLIPETIFYLITGRFYFGASLKLFLFKKAKAAASKKRLKQLIAPGQKLLSVQEVFDYILKSIGSKNIVRF